MFSSFKTFLSTVEKKLDDFKGNSSPTIDHIDKSIKDTLSIDTLKHTLKTSSETIQASIRKGHGAALEETQASFDAGRQLLTDIEGKLDTVHKNNQDIFLKSQKADAQLIQCIKVNNNHYRGLMQMTTAFETLPQIHDTLKQVNKNIDDICWRVDQLEIVLDQLIEEKEGINNVREREWISSQPTLEQVNRQFEMQFKRQEEELERRHREEQRIQLEKERQEEEERRQKEEEEQQRKWLEDEKKRVEEEERKWLAEEEIRFAKEEEEMEKASALERVVKEEEEQRKWLEEEKRKLQEEEERAQKDRALKENAHREGEKETETEAEQGGEVPKEDPFASPATLAISDPFGGDDDFFPDEPPPMLM